MGTLVQCILCLFCLVFDGVTCQYVRINAAFGVGNPRVKRQAGYVYDRPSISFNLPSRNTVASTSSQATTVDRTSAQQMYYAYPAPAGDTGSTGYSNAGSTSSSGATGYNYAEVSQNTASGSTGGSTSTIRGSGSSGYSYGGNTQSVASGSTGGTTSTITGSGSSGYSYGGNTQSVASGSTGSTTSSITTGSSQSGYNYGGNIQNTASGSIGGTTTITSGGGGGGGYTYSGGIQNSPSGSVGGSINTVTTDSELGSSGYNYGSAIQNTVSGQTGGTITTVNTSGTSGSGGYNYETQNVGNRGTSTVNTVSNLYSVPLSGSNSAKTVINSISTNAPQYLPPTGSGGTAGGSITTTQTVSEPTAVAPSDTYLPPVQNAQSVTVTQSGGNVPAVNTAIQTSNAPLSGPNASYLQPSKSQETSNVQTTQSQVSVQPGVSVQSVPTQDYLPPTVNTGTRTQISVSRPAATYLPPVF